MVSGRSAALLILSLCTMYLCLYCIGSNRLCGWQLHCVEQAAFLLSVCYHPNIMWSCLFCRGFVRERVKPSRQLRDSQPSAAEGRPLGAMIHVLGINHSISASAVFGDFYRCAALLDLGQCSSSMRFEYFSLCSSEQV